LPENLMTFNKCSTNDYLLIKWIAALLIKVNKDAFKLK
jgi:hypothetical protein